LNSERFIAVQDITKPASYVPKEPSIFLTLSTHLSNQFLTSQLVYERLYPDCVPVSKKKSRHFTELLKIKNSDYSSEETGIANIEGDLAPYYKLKEPTDETLVFESRFESGNLCLALKVILYK